RKGVRVVGCETANEGAFGFVYRNEGAFGFVYRNEGAFGFVYRNEGACGLLTTDEGCLFYGLTAAGALGSVVISPKKGAVGLCTRTTGAFGVGSNHQIGYVGFINSRGVCFDGGSHHTGLLWVAATALRGVSWLGFHQKGVCMVYSKRGVWFRG
ncbi:hypothetical protein Tco_1340290, partial [Tanacetum coccineum]